MMPQNLSSAQDMLKMADIQETGTPARSFGQWIIRRIHAEFLPEYFQ